MTRLDGLDRERAALTFVVRSLRPDWDERGITKQLTDARDAGHPFGLVCRAAIDAATTTSTRTPAGMTSRLRDGWKSDQPIERERPVTTGPTCVICEKCRGLIVATEDEPHVCNPKSSPETRALARKVAAEARGEYDRAMGERAAAQTEDVA